MINNIEFENSLYGTKAILKGLWQESNLKLLLDKNVQEIELNDGKGWRGDNVDFLRSLPNLKSLILIDLSIKSIDAIHSLSGLIKLHLTTYCKKPVNFNNFPNLINCGFEWIKGSDSLFECKNLIALGINKYDNTSSKAFSKLLDLEKLTLMNPKIENLEGLAKLKNLVYLSIVNSKNLTSLHGLQNLHELLELEIQRCKGISNISEVFHLKKLKRLLLIDLGNIKSLQGIEYLADLKELLFYESTNIIDGDLLPITKLKHLNKISFQNRKHYTHKREYFGKIYA